MIDTSGRETHTVNREEGIRPRGQRLVTLGETDWNGGCRKERHETERKKKENRNRKGRGAQGED